jgi:hypothetical protein
MARPIVSIPRELFKVSVTNWRIRWGGQSAGSDTGGGDQIVFNRFPRWVGEPRIVMGDREIRAWQAILDMAQGRFGLYRVPMIERLRSPFDTGEIPNTGVMPLTAGDMSGRRDIEPRPVVYTSFAASAGDTSIIVDEQPLRAPIPVGWILSHEDWPFRVKWREPYGDGLTRLGVSFVRRPIPAAAAIDIFATGLFIGQSDEGAFPEIEGETATISMAFEEFITR